MATYFQIIIGLMCIYLFYKGCEIFQIAFVSQPENPKTRKTAMILGVIAILGAVVIGIGVMSFTSYIDYKINQNLENLQKSYR